MSEAIEAAEVADAPEHHLVVIHPFDTFKRGDHITNPDQINDVLNGENARSVHKIYPL